MERVTALHSVRQMKMNTWWQCILLSSALMLLCPQQVFAAEEENKIVDTLKSIKSANKDDEQVVNALIEQATGEDKALAQIKLLSIYRRSAQFDKAKELLSQLRTQQHGFTQATQVEIIANWALLERGQNKYAKASEVIIQYGLPLAGDDAKLLARVYRLAGNFNRLEMKLDKAQKYYFLALEHFRAIDDQEGEAKMYSNLGVLYESMDDLVTSAKYQLKAMRYFEQTGDTEQLANNYFNLGELYYRSEDYEKSMSFYQKALQYDKKLNSAEFMGYDYHRIGSIYLKQKHFNQALDYTQKAIDIFAQGGFEQVLARAYLQKANIYLALGDQIQRIENLLLAEASAIKANVDHQLRSVWHGLGVYYQDHEKFNKAREYVEKSLAISTQLGMLNHQILDNKLLSDIHQALNESESALRYLNTAYRLHQNLTDEQRIKELEKHKRDVNLLQEQVKVAKLEEEGRKAELELIAHKERAQRVTFLTVGLVIVFIVLSYLLHQRRKIALLKANLYEEALSQKNQLLADVSHELRTPLTALKLQVDALRFQLVDDVELSYQKLSGKITDLSNLIGDIYELAVSDVYGLSFNAQPIDIVTHIKQWQGEFKQLTSAEGLQWHQQVLLDNAIVDVDVVRIKQVLSNLISNSIKYTDKPGRVELSVMKKRDYLSIRVQDTSPSVPEEELERIFERLYRVEKSRNRQTGGSGLGLAISQNIIHAHNGLIYARKSRIGGVAVFVKLPLVSN